MGLFDAFKKKKTVNFEEIDSIGKAQEECKKGNLERMYIMSPIFGGTADPHNILYVPVGINKIKEGMDNTLADLVEQGKTSSFNCKPEYKGKSVIPSRITITSGKDGVEVFKQTIEIW
ncbi:hypothetical protein B0O40_1787 [Ruminococcaceae bacterium R-25]|nr:hypothetical protein B0O40_1787 [Ruminococcaceae bacterium R-25]SUQ21651.1 hypothetical protein SAMN06297423_1787 [Oscillospiraceae bacterium]